MTRDELVEQKLTELRELCGEPVLPLSRFCDAITTWFRCIEKLNQESKDAFQQGVAYAGHLRHIERDIRKSNLLARLLYGGEKLRTKQCPKHKGHWSGISICEHGCASTGWIPDDFPEKADPCYLCGKPVVAVIYSVNEPHEQQVCYDHYVEVWEGKKRA